MIKKLIQNKRNVISYIIGLIVSSCCLATGTSPFGFAILGATASLEIPILIPFIGIAIITLLKFGWMALLKFVISSVIFVALKSFLKSDEPSKLNNTVKMLVASAIGEAICLLMSNTLVYDSLLAIYSVVTSAVFYLIFSSAMSVLVNYSSKNVISSEDMIATSAMVTIMLSAIGDTSILGISIRGMISVLIVMILGWKLGPCVGATAGITTSIVAGLMGYGSAITIATYGFSGLLSGILARFGKIGAIIGFILGNAILAFYANGSTEVIINLKEIVVASVFLFILPKNISLIMDDLFDYDGSLTSKETKLFQKNTIYKLNAMSEVIDDIATSENDESQNQSEELRIFIKTLNENACKKCSRHDECWNKSYHSMYETVFNMVEILQTNGEVNEGDIEENTPCTNKEILVDGLNFSYQIYKVNQNWQEKMNEQRRESKKQLKEVSNVINNIMQSSLAVEENIKKEKYKLSIGVAKCKKDGSLVSGDNYINVKLKDNKYLIGISDGMGSGEKANKKSKKVISMLENLLKTGFEKNSAVELVNSVMVSSDDDIFATLDASIIDLATGNTEFIKVSSCPTYIKHNSTVDMVQSVGLPIGILDNIDIDLYGKNIEKGDIIVMLTDGILDANNSYNPKELWITELLKAVKSDNPQRLADIILQEAIDSNYGVIKDDMTILVALVE